MVTSSCIPLVVFFLFILFSKEKIMNLRSAGGKKDKKAKSLVAIYTLFKTNGSKA